MKQFAIFIWSGNLGCLTSISALRCYRYRNPGKVIRTKILISGVCCTWIVSLLMLLLLISTKELPNFLEKYCSKHLFGATGMPKKIVALSMLAILLICTAVIVRSYLKLIISICTKRKILHPEQFVDMSRFRPRSPTAHASNMEIFAVTQNEGLSARDIVIVSNNEVAGLDDVLPPVIGGQQESSNQTSDQNGNRRIIEKDKKAIISSVIVVSIYIVSYIPLITGILVNSKTRLSDETFRHFFLFNLLNNFLNPFVYTLRNEAFRNGISSLLGKKKVSPNKCEPSAP